MALSSITGGSNPAKTYTIEDFIDMKTQDEITYINYSILNYNANITYTDQCILDFYMKELKDICLEVTDFTQEEINKYRYAPDLLAYDIYGSTQLDFIVLLCNGIIDPKEFDLNKGKIYLPTLIDITNFLSETYSSESEWLNINRGES